MKFGVCSPVRRLSSARAALLPVLACSGLWGCVDDTELFPAIASVDTASPESAPGDGAASAGSAPADGTSASGAVAGLLPQLPARPTGDGSQLEQPRPIELDPARTGGTPSGTPPTTSDATPQAATPDDEPEPSAAAPGVEPPAAPLPPVEAGAPQAGSLCVSAFDPLLLDFAGPSNDPAQALFGDFESVLSGGTYVYPDVAPNAQQPEGLRSDVTEGDWHISGTVAQQAGFGLFLDCQLLDASRFAGLAFRVSGNVEGAGSITLLIGTADNDVSSEWLVANGGVSTPGAGRCTPRESEFDGTCNQARIEIPVTRQARDVLVPFAALGQGSPEPGVNPAEITTIAWALPSPELNRFGEASPYDVDLRFDDIRFVEAPAPALPAGG